MEATRWTCETLCFTFRTLVIAFRRINTSSKPLTFDNLAQSAPPRLSHSKICLTNQGCFESDNQQYNPFFPSPAPLPGIETQHSTPDPPPPEIPTPVYPKSPYVDPVFVQISFTIIRDSQSCIPPPSTTVSAGMIHSPERFFQHMSWHHFHNLVFLT